MADNVDSATAPNIPVATRSVSYSGDAGQNAQVVGLVAFAGSDDAKTAADIGGDETNGLDVDVTRIVPGTGATNLGKAEDAAHTTGDVGVMVLGVRNDANASYGADGDYTPVSTDAGGNQNVRARKDLVRVSVQSAGLTTAATAYAAGDQLGNQFTIAGCARESGGSGMIVGALVISAADTIGAIDLVLFDSSVTLAADNAAFAISDADALKLVGMVPLAGAFDIGNNRICVAYNLAIPYVCSGGTSLYAALITRFAIAATPFAAATDIQLVLFLERN